MDWVVPWPIRVAGRENGDRCTPASCSSRTHRGQAGSAAVHHCIAISSCVACAVIVNGNTHGARQEGRVNGALRVRGPSVLVGGQSVQHERLSESPQSVSGDAARAKSRYGGRCRGTVWACWRAWGRIFVLCLLRLFDTALAFAGHPPFSSIGSWSIVRAAVAVDTPRTGGPRRRRRWYSSSGCSQNGWICAAAASLRMSGSRPRWVALLFSEQLTFAIVISFAMSSFLQTRGGVRRGITVGCDSVVQVFTYLKWARLVAELGADSNPPKTTDGHSYRQI